MPTGTPVRRFRLVWWIAALAVACSGGDGGPAPPTDFSVVQSPASFDDLFVSWTPPAGEVSGYEGEGCIVGGACESLGDIPGDAIGGTLTLDPALPEITRFTFRIRSVRGGERSSWAEASYLRALRWPADVQSQPVRDGVRIAWTNASVAATAVRVERRFEQQWRSIAELPATAASWTDGEELVAAQPIEYRLRATAGAVESLPVSHLSEGYPASPVADLTASAEATGVRLRWVNPPVAAEAIEIHRAEGLAAAYFSDLFPVVLPSTATEYLDPLPGGTWTWNVVTRYPLGLGAPYSQVRGASHATGSFPMRATLVPLPDAAAIASDGAERLAFAVGGSFYPPATGTQRIAFRGAGAPPELDLGTTHGWASPSVAFDATGNVHSVVLQPVAGDPPVAIVHVWHDGSSWKEEEIARRALDDPTTVRFALDGSGAVHVAWTTGGGGARGEYARPDGAGWSIDDLTSLLPADAKLAGLDVDGLGVPSLAIASGPIGPGAYALLARRETGGWTLETLPILHWLVRDLRRSSTGLDAVGLDVPFDGSSVDILLVERTAAGWGPRQVVRTIYPTQPVDALRVARAATGDRLAVCGNAVDRLEIDVHAPSGWTRVETSARIGLASEAWFDATGKLHVLARTDGYPDVDGNAPYLLHVEP